MSVRVRKFIREWILGVVLPVWVVATFLLMVARVDGDSMQPTLDSGDRLLLYKLPRWLATWGVVDDWPRRDQLVVFRGPAGQPDSYARGAFGVTYRPYLIKRVVGVPGDVIELRGGTLYRNGVRIAESYTTGDAGQDTRPVRVPEGTVYVLGDNRRLGESIDSRYFGPVPLKDIAGSAGVKIWPPG